MSVDSRLKVPKGTGITTETFIKIVKSFPEFSESFPVDITHESIFFHFNFNNEKRMLQIHQDYDYFSISLGSWGSEEIILRRIGKRIGGFLELADSGKYEEIFPVTKGNIEFLLQDAIITGVFDDAENSEEQAECFIQYLKSYT